MDAYTEIETPDKLYDRSVAWKVDNVTDEYPSTDSQLITVTGATLDIGNQNLTIDASASSVYVVDTSANTITIKANTLSESIKYSFIKTTGIISLENGATTELGYEDADGIGISSAANNNDGTFTLTFTDGTTFTTADFTGPQGATGAKGDPGNQGESGVGISSTMNNGNGTFTLNYTNGSFFTTPDFTGAQGTAGNGISSTTENNNGTITFTYDDDSTFTTSSLITSKTITSDMIFDGTDDNISSNDNYYYVSMVVNGNWRLTRFDEANINLERVATVDNNAGQTTQPMTLAVCTGLNYE